MHTCNDDEPKLGGRWNEYGVNDDEDDKYEDVDDGSGDGHRSLAGSPKCPTKALIKVTAAAPEGRSRESHLSSRLSRESTRAADCVGGVDLGYRPNGPVAVHFLAHSHHLQGRKEREDKEGVK